MKIFPDRNHFDFDKTVLLSIALVFVPLIVTTLLYWPGLTGQFLFDDFPNLDPLARSDFPDTYTKALNFVFSGISGPSGRPISLLSFLINDTAMPADPWGFLFTNVMIHVLNGVLIYWFIYKTLLSTGHREKTTAIVASVTSLVWLVHPLNVSTVLYIIQRMTELGSLFTLAGLISYVYGRDFLRSKKQKAAIWCLGIAYPLFGLLGIFSKEMAITILLYIVVLELSVFQSKPFEENIRTYKFWYWGFVIIPIFIVIFYLAAKFSIRHYDVRDFTLGERLLTEARIVIDYLSQVLLPRLGYLGVFHDDHKFSTSLLNPITTLTSILTLIGILTISLKYRKTYPIYCLAGLWFLAGHLLESTFLPLELYFEHRNYLPMLGPLFAIVYFVVIDPSRVKMSKYIGLTLFVSLCGIYTALNTSLWGKPRVSTLVWAEEHPSSIRAQQTAASMYLAAGNINESLKHISIAQQFYPLDGGILLQVIYLNCLSEQLSPEKLQNIQSKLNHATRSLAATRVIEKLATLAINGSCPSLDKSNVQIMISSLLANDNFSSDKERHTLYYWQGNLFADQRQLNRAMDAFDTSYRYLKAIEIPLQQAVWLHSAGLTDAAQKYIKIAKDLDRQNTNPLLQNSRRADIRRIEDLLYNKQNIKIQTSND